MTLDDRHGPNPVAFSEPIDDPLGEILHLLKVTGTFYCQARLTAPWGIDVPTLPDAMTFVVVMGGRCWLKVGDAEPVQIEQGNLVLMTSTEMQVFQSDPGAETVALGDLPVRRVTEVYETLSFGGGGAETTLMYGILRIDHAAAGLLMDFLPDVLQIDTWSLDTDGWLQSTLRFIAREARALRPGGEAVITRLADVVVIEAIRSWINAAPEADRGWLRGARDAQIGKAIMAIHRAPSEDWTLGSLARASGMSRSAFAARFTDIVGMPAMRYLTLWRMQLARTDLTRTPRPIAAIAADLGYQSEPAFSRAFKRIFGLPPGEIRRRASAAP